MLTKTFSRCNYLSGKFCSVFTEEDKTDLPSMKSKPYQDMHHFNIGLEDVGKLQRKDQI